MYKINPEKFDSCYQGIKSYVQAAQWAGKIPDPDKIRFDSGWFYELEGYKKRIWDIAQNTLRYSTWKESEIHDSGLVDRVVDCMYIPESPGLKEPHNLLDFRDREYFKDLAYGDKKAACEFLIYQIYRGVDEEVAFNHAIDLLGARYPLISFLFFLKDKARFIPVRPKVMADKLAEFGIESACLNRCSWENYKEFLQILFDIKQMLQSRINSSVELLDAHSFFWSVYVLNEEKADPLPFQFYSLDHEINQTPLSGKDREALVKVRVNQSVFRDRLLKRYKKCALCGVANPELLIASHIRPWSASSQIERLDVDNGFLLCPNHDRLFDGGWITFDDNGEIVISSELSIMDRLFTNVTDGMRVTLTPGNQIYLKYHRDNIFRDSTLKP